MHKHNSMPVSLSSELKKFGLAGRINLKGIDPDRVEVFSEEHGCASPFEGNRGEREEREYGTQEGYHNSAGAGI